MLNQWTYYIKHSAYITQNPTEPLSDISGVNLTDYVHLLLETQKAFNMTFFT